MSATPLPSGVAYIVGPPPGGGFAFMVGFPQPIPIPPEVTAALTALAEVMLDAAEDARR